jgi:hypothetical protein
MVPFPEPVLTPTVYVVLETGVTLTMEAPVMDGLATSPKSLNGARVSTPVTGSEKVTVKFTVTALVGFASARVIDKTVGAASVANSKAPISGALPENWSLIPGITTPRSMFELEESSVKSR